MTKFEVGKEYWIKAEYKKINDFNDLHHWFEIAGALDGLVMLGDVSEVKEVIQEPLGVLLVDVPEPSHWEYVYLYKRLNGVYGVKYTDDRKVVIGSITAIKVTEAEAKEKYPNFKWVSLEELENE